MGKLHICKSTVVDKNSVNSALFFQHLSFQIYHVIHQQELNTLTHWREHTVKNTAKLRRKIVFFTAYHKNIQRKLIVAYLVETPGVFKTKIYAMPAKIIKLKKNIFSSKVRPPNNQHAVLNIRDICIINSTSIKQVTSFHRKLFNWTAV